MLTSAAGDFNSDWDGPLSSGHSRSANIILFPTISELKKKIPSDETYLQDEKLELEWNEHFPQLQNFIEEKVAHYAKVLALPQP